MGEAAFILRDLTQEPYVLARAIELSQLPGVEEVIASISTVGIYVNPDEFKPESLNHLVATSRNPGRLFTVPVVFNGADLSDVAKQLLLEPGEVVQMFCANQYVVASIGFLPGFPYLKGLPKIFSDVVRRDSPRIHVPAGSVAIAAGQAGIYPSESPGGWQILGTTPLLIANLQHKYFPLNPGDQIQFVEMEESKAETIQGQLLTEYETN
jgi:KipI family sensor histidine kinase inhibitor